MGNINLSISTDSASSDRANPVIVDLTDSSPILSVVIIFLSPATFSLVGIQTRQPKVVAKVDGEGSGISYIVTVG